MKNYIKKIKNLRITKKIPVNYICSLTGKECYRNTELQFDIVKLFKFHFGWIFSVGIVILCMYLIIAPIAQA